LWILVLLLCGFGLVMVASTTAGMNGRQAALNSLNYGFLVKQALALVVGLAVAVSLSCFGSRRLRQWWVVALISVVSVGSLLAVLLIGREINGARRWIDLGPINLQPAELAKFALVLIAAWHLTRIAERVRVNWYGVLLPLAAFSFVAGLVYLTRDLGSVVVMAVVLGAMLFFAGARWWYFLGLIGGCLPALLFTTVYQVAYRRERMLAFWDPWNAEGPTGHHLRQSFIAIGSGGLFGVGLGQSHAKMLFLPEKHTDFIYAVICEEWGLVGGVVVAGMYLMLVITGLMIAARTRDRHNRLLAIGAALVLGTQAFWNMLVVVGAVPTKGLTLPFISYGGSSMVVCLALVGLVDAAARSCVGVRRRTTNSRIGAAVVANQAWRWQQQQ
jgi:cell division protein FtsW